MTFSTTMLFYHTKPISILISFPSAFANSITVFELRYEYKYALARQSAYSSPPNGNFLLPIFKIPSFKKERRGRARTWVLMHGPL